MRDALLFDRSRLLAFGFDPSIQWDVIVIGGGATGLGTAVDAASRGYKTLVIEQDDFGKGTSSRSTKLVHGGVRYLRQGNISLVLEALEERGRLLRNAPHLVRALPFVIPCYKWWEQPYYGLGLKVYQAMSRNLGLGPTTILSRAETRESLPTATAARLRGGVCYYDGLFDDARLVINLAQTCASLGGVPLNYVRATDLRRRGGRISSVIVRDLENGSEAELRTRAVINATGVFADSVRKLDDPETPDIIRPSKGIHLVLDSRFLASQSAMMIPRTDDGRVLFAIPWNDRVIFGTTDTPVDRAELEPSALAQDIDYLLDHAGRYLTRVPTREDVLSVFAGLRPLVSSGGSDETKLISRDHVLRVSRTGLVTITGGKWTTYRRMAEDAVDHAAQVAGLEHRPSKTASLRIHGGGRDYDDDRPLGQYGSDLEGVQVVIDETPDGSRRLHHALPYRRGEVRWAVRREMARTVEDVLARRTRALLLDAKASIEAASDVASIMADELCTGTKWAQGQVAAYERVALSYLPDRSSGWPGRPVDQEQLAHGHHDTV